MNFPPNLSPKLLPKYFVLVSFSLALASSPIFAWAAGEGEWTHFKKPSEEALKAKLTPIQFKVTQKKGTESPFSNEYAHNEKAGIYVDIVSGEPLFSSLDKYDSGTGWPSFSQPMEPGNIVLKPNNSFFSTRTEVRSKYGDSHLGHVFDDGPPSTGKRFCMNSASLKFIPVTELKAAGYEKYLPLFQKK